MDLLASPYVTPRIAFETLGCRANTYDTESMMAACRKLGFLVVPFEQEAEVYVVNTCTVTESADAQGRQLLRKAHRKNQEALVIATGCSAEMYPELIYQQNGVDAVFGTQNREELLQYLVDSFAAIDEPEDTPSLEVPVEQRRSRAYLKIQDGCDNRCTFCIIWRARGKSRSKSIEELVEDTNRLVKAGYKEIVLTGIHIGSYGKDLANKKNLADLIEALFANTGLHRLRLSSLDPECVDERIEQFYIKEPRMCRYLHLSLQSGSDEVIKQMRRKTKSAQACQLIERLAANVPGMAISADIIAGFPGETVMDHEQTKELLAKSNFSWIHVFPFSARTGTAAARRVDRLDPALVKTRAKELTVIAQQKRLQFYQSQIGKTLEVVALSSTKGVSDNDVPVHLPAAEVVRGECYQVIVKNVIGGKVHGEWILAQMTKSA